jgi:tRNA 2-thiouridine synthesizing protein A
VRLLATDPAARSDVAAFCRMRGHELVATTDEPEHTAYLVRRVG